MKFKTGEHIVYIGTHNDEYYNCCLVKNGTYVVRNQVLSTAFGDAFGDDAETMFVSVSEEALNESWYVEAAFLSLKEFRKMKLVEINKKCT
jgi:hypothetical protein